MGLCVSAWNWLKPMGMDARLALALEAAAAAGFGVELWLDWTPEPDRFARENWPSLARACRGMPGLSLHTRLIHHFDRQTIVDEIELAAFLGADPLVVHPRSLGLDAGTWDPHMTAVLDESALAVIRDILACARERSVRLALENGALDLLAAVGDAFPADTPDGRHLGICIDLGHANLHRGLFPDPAAHYLRAFADRLVHLHVADNDGTADQHLVPGSGNVDWSTVADTLTRIPYRGNIVLELNEPDPGAAARRATDFLGAAGIGAG